MAAEESIAQLLAELEAHGLEHDAHESVHARRLLNLEPDTAQLVSILVQSGRRTRLLELGTSNGYSTIWLARALRATGGRLISIERDAAKQAQADASLRRAGLREVVDLRLGDATALVTDLPGPFDCVFFDADRRSYPQQLALLLPKLTPDVLLLADNVLSHPDEIAPYLAAIAALPGFARVVAPTGKGLSIAYRGGSPPS
jgi:predicted O-methyltransferase YrrM